MPGEITKPALAELVEQGATAEGDDTSSVAAAVMLAVDLAAEEMDFSKAHIVALHFADDGSVNVYSVPEAKVEAVKAALAVDGIESGTIAAEDLKRAFDEAEEVEDSERESIPPPAMPSKGVAA